MAISARPISRGRWWCEARTPIAGTDRGGSRRLIPLIPWRSMMACKDPSVAQWAAQLGSRDRGVWVFECRRLRERSRPLLRERARIETLDSSLPWFDLRCRPLLRERARIETAMSPAHTPHNTRRPLLRERARIETTMSAATACSSKVARSYGSGRGLKHAAAACLKRHNGVARSYGSGRGLKRPSRMN